MDSRARGVRELDLWRRNRAFCPWQVLCTPPATGPSTWVCFPLGLNNCPPIRPRLDKIKYLAPAQATPGNPAPHWLRAERSKPSLHIPNGPQPGFTLSALLELEGGSEPSAGRSGLAPPWICLDGACACRTATGRGLVKAAPLPLSGLGSQGAVDHPLPPALPPQPEAMLGTPVHHFSRPGGQSSKETHRAEGVWRDQLNFRWGFLIITMVVPGSVLGRGWPNPTPTCPAFWGGSRNKRV